MNLARHANLNLSNLELAVALNKRRPLLRHLKNTAAI